MRKQELVQLHALCVVIRQHLEDRHELPSGPFERYEECLVSPTSIHRRKDAHKAALFRLLDGLADVTAERSSPSGQTPAATE